MQARVPEALRGMCSDDRAPLVAVVAVYLVLCALGDYDLSGYLTTFLAAAAGLLGLSRSADRTAGANAAKKAAAKGAAGLGERAARGAAGAPQARRPGGGAGPDGTAGSSWAEFANKNVGGTAQSDEERLKAAMRSLKQDADPTATCYAAAMEVCNKRDLAKVALGIFDLMLERGFGHDQQLIDRRTSVGFFKLVVHSIGDERLRKDGLRLLDAIRAHGLSPAIGAQDYLIVAWRSKLPEHVVKYFVKMREESIVLSWTAIRCVMSFYQWSDPAFTLTLYGELTERGVRPDRVHFNAALTAYCELGKMDQAVQLLKDGPDLQVEPNAQTYQIVIRSYTSKGNDKDALALFEAMRDGLLNPYRATYRDAVLCCVRLKRFADAATLCNGMAPGSQRPGEAVGSFLRRTCMRYDWADTAAHLAEDFAHVRRAPAPSARRP